MTTLTLLSGPMDHMTTSATYLLSTSLVASSPTTATTTTTTTGHKIAPKRQRQESTSSELSSPASFRSSKRSRSNGGAAPAVARRNERERNRVRQVNQGFQTLRQHVPNGAKSKKMSKVETLRSAVQYIKQLQQLLGSGDEDDENSVPSFDEQFRHLRPHYGGQSAAMTNSEYGDGMVALAGGVTVGFGGLTPASSPTPSLGSDASSPYDSLSPEDEELLDFTTWLS